MTHNKCYALIDSRGGKMGKEEIASKLRQARIKSNMTQREVADILGMTYQAISNYERGKTKVESDILVKLCKIYNISVPDVLSDTSISQKIVTEIKKEEDSSKDLRLQEIINCYVGMTEEGKNLLLGQAQFYYQQFPELGTNARAM